MNLREEIVEHQRTRTDLFKWKVILIAGIGAAASGVGGFQLEHRALLFVLVPLVCVYVDLLARDQTLRIVVIAEYLRGGLESSQKEGRYEDFVARADNIKLVSSWAALRFRLSRKQSAYALGFAAEDFSTVLVSVFILAAGLMFYEEPDWSWQFGLHAQPIDGLVLACSATLGLVITGFAYVAYLRRWVTVLTDFPHDRVRSFRDDDD
jgi:hypothetical protein